MSIFDWSPAWNRRAPSRGAQRPEDRVPDHWDLTHVAKMQGRPSGLIEDNWNPQQTLSHRRVVIGATAVQDRGTESAGGSGDISVPVATQVSWIGALNLSGDFVLGDVTIRNTNTAGFIVGSALDDGNNDIPTGATVASIIDASTMTMSVPALATINGHPFTLTDHTITAGPPANGLWTWNFNLFAEFGFPGAASFFIGYGGTVQSGTVQMDLELCDAALNVLTSVTAIASYTVDLTTFPAFTYTAALLSLTYSANAIAAFNAVRVRSTCSNVNLAQLLNYGPLGSFPIVGAFVVYPKPTTLISSLPTIGV